MTMKKKILTTLSVVLILGMAALGILAYLTDTDQDVNVMTLGNVQIDQIENFEQGSALDPSVTVTKEVTVKNVGESAAYVRTWLAFENPMDKIEPVWGTEKPSYVGVATIDGTEYTIYVADYGKMEADQTIVKNPLDAVKMKPEATNEDVAKYGDTYEVLVFSQAIQTAGFTTSDAAWTAHFGAATIANHPWKNFKKVDTAEELKAALAAGSNIILMDDIDMADTKLTVAADSTIDLNGNTLSGDCNSSQAYLIMVNNGATLDIKDSSADKSGKITYSEGSSNVGWTIDLEGQLNLYSGTIELTGDSWSIGYAVDVRPNAWGTNYSEETVFHMYGGKVVSSDGAIRVASSSYDSYSNISAQFIMDGGDVEAAWDGIFVQQSNAAYDTLGVTVNAGTITSKLAPIRVYGPDATSVNSGAEKPMTIIANKASLVMDGAADPSRTWYEEGKIMYGGGMSLDNLNKYANIVLK